MAFRGPYALQAAIASLQLEPPVDWPQVVALYTAGGRDPLAGGRLNRAVAIAEAGDVAGALRLVDALALDDYRYLHSTRAELLRRLGRVGEARPPTSARSALGGVGARTPLPRPPPLRGFPGFSRGALRAHAEAGNVTRSDLTHTAATAALELLPDGVLVVCDGEVVLANRALARLTGEDLTGCPAPDWLPASGHGEECRCTAARGS